MAKHACPPEPAAWEGSGSSDKDFSGNSGLDCSLQLDTHALQLQPLGPRHPGNR